MVQEQQALIDAYLLDEAKLYQDWYQEISQAKHESYVVPYAISPPSLEEIKQRFKNYFLEKQAFFKQEICIEWDYPRKIKEYGKVTLLIAALADYFVAAGLATITVLVLEGYLDSLCTDSSKDRSSFA
jgi:hypothetical protein